MVYGPAALTTLSNTITNSLGRARIPRLRRILRCYGWRCWRWELRPSQAVHELKFHLSLLVSSPKRLE